MTERIYSARPINTYKDVGAHVGNAYVAFLQTKFPGAVIIDPASKDIALRAKELMEQDMIDPATKQSSLAHYEKNGGKGVMEYFTDVIVPSCTLGAGLALPVMQEGEKVFALGAGVAAELNKMNELGRPTWVVTCEMVVADADAQHHFFIQRVINVGVDFSRGLDPVSKRPLHVYFVEGGTSFRQLTVDETRARMYTPNPDGTWNRDKLQPYFLQDK